MSFFSRRRRQHLDAQKAVLRNYVAPVHAAVAPYATGVLAWATSAAVGAVYSPYVGAAVGLGVTYAGGEGSAYWAEMDARGDGKRGDEADAAGEVNRQRAYEAGVIGTLVGTWGSVNISQWGVLSAETAASETALMSIGQNYQTIVDIVSPPGDGGHWYDGLGWGPEDYAGEWYRGYDLPAAEQNSPMLDDEDDDEDDKPKKKRRKRRYQVNP